MTMWNNVNKKLPKPGLNVLVAEKVAGVMCYNIRWRTDNPNVLQDANGFVKYIEDEEVLAWRTIPKYYPK